MEQTTRVIATHLIFQLLYSSIIVFVSFYENPNEYYYNAYCWLDFMTYLAIAIGIHVLVTLILFVVDKEKSELRKANLLGILVILLLGASICFSVPSIL